MHFKNVNLNVFDTVSVSVNVSCMKVVVMEVKDLSCLSSNKIVYCTMEVDGGDKLQTDQAEASKPWSVLGSAFQLEMGKNPHCLSSVLFGFYQIPGFVRFGFFPAIEK